MKDGAKETGAAWDANLYDAKHGFVWKYGADLVALLDPRAGECILDLGCGTGHLTAKIAESCALVTGVDRSAEMVSAARLAFPNLKFEVMDARNLTYQDEFDAVFSNAALHWIRDPEAVLQGIRRSLRSGGRFVAELGGKGNVQAVKEAFDRALVELGAARPGEVEQWYFPSAGEYAALAERNGLEVRLAALFDRPTALADGAEGLRNWIAMFGGEYLATAGQSRREDFLRRIEDTLRPRLFRDGQWWLDYRRLRIAACK